ncbi:MAG: hypothetical protein LBI77_03490 [Puniceicoccales bacterium]|jgi:YrbI family 3-deoxy-D-manno-octulosonate 8-phosphate phosphatase|nr:hypothetical protein [Puniceicoccales bacterium]
MNSPLNLKEIKWVIIGDGMLWNFQNILTLPPDANSISDSIFFCDERQMLFPIQGIPFSTYDGFAIKNILGHALNIPSTAILQSFDFSEIIQRRCRDLKIPSCFTGIQNKAQFIGQFCRDHRCTLGDVLIFDNDLRPSDFQGERPNFLIANPNAMIPHFIRSFVNGYANHCGEVLSYFNETRMQGTDYPEHIRSEARKTRALVCDIDGTCTDGFKIYGEDGSLWKRFSPLDMQALKTWNGSGNLSFFITGESGSISQKFAEQCHIPADHVFGNAGNQKVQILCKICQQHALTLGEIAYIGDGMNDLGIIEFLIRENGSAACSANAMPSIQEIPRITKLQTTGGQGSVAEWIETLSQR